MRLDMFLEGTPLVCWCQAPKYVLLNFDCGGVRCSKVSHEGVLSRVVFMQLSVIIPVIQRSDLFY